MLLHIVIIVRCLVFIVILGVPVDLVILILDPLNLFFLLVLAIRVDEYGLALIFTEADVTLAGVTECNNILLGRDSAINFLAQLNVVIIVLLFFLFVI